MKTKCKICGKLFNPEYDGDSLCSNNCIAEHDENKSLFGDYYLEDPDLPSFLGGAE